MTENETLRREILRLREALTQVVADITDADEETFDVMTPTLDMVEKTLLDESYWACGTPPEIDEIPQFKSLTDSKREDIDDMVARMQTFEGRGAARKLFTEPPEAFGETAAEKKDYCPSCGEDDCDGSPS